MVKVEGRGGREEEREGRESAALPRNPDFVLETTPSTVARRQGRDGVTQLIHGSSSSSSSWCLTIGVAVDYTTPWIGVVQLAVATAAAVVEEAAAVEVEAVVRPRVRRFAKCMRRERESRGARERAGSIAPKSERKESWILSAKTFRSALGRCVI